jgi:hypothetical protein
LRDMGAFRGFGDAAVFQDRQIEPQAPQIHFRSPPGRFLSYASSLGRASPSQLCDGRRGRARRASLQRKGWSVSQENGG